ncbi:type IV pilus inner membrane component PilO [Moraxella catarrhalis]|uniref:type 4a pilus biogenesis protein PilO n=1 Tax=Moraxella catarrhalis TaxID=480 RepID=UPI000669719E|nr:type 4a pilus biogenesis protein PilO [Moraxella catarrhalis]AXT95301.1 pilus assembly protein PilO [Moraxella catarrhalis]MCG6818528.1 type 4a pilus biogenesis protein PilO [Moraxella catarrhalis]MPW50651.1 pilus assembly protein PilO [Moraxella catarrhalis]MPX20264.1 pilus assembly protein PilO [Moraxella catarrhalis]MPX40150.1 pilus assembly protein PilO [Moraxella catarrhalis]
MNNFVYQLQSFWYELNQVNRHTIAQSPKYIQLTVLGLIVMIIGIFGWLLAILPTIQKLNAAQSQESALIDEFATKYHKAQQFDHLSHQVIQKNTQLENQLNALPRTAPMSEIIGMINTKAQAVNVQVVSASVQAGREQDYYTERPIAVSATGNYHALGRWLLELSEAKHLLTVHDFDLKAGLNHQLMMIVQMKTYQANKRPKPVAQQVPDVQ